MFGILESRISAVRLIFLLNFVSCLIYVFTVGLTIPQLMIIFCIFFMMNCLGITATYHRYYSHKSYEFKYKWYEKLCMLFAMLSCSGSALGWAGIHRTHHKYSDTNDDPHQASRGLWNMLSLEYDSKFSPKIIADLLKNKFIHICHAYYFVPIIVYTCLLYFLWGFTGVIVGFSFPAFITLASEGLTNYINHAEKNAYAPKNVWWMNFFSFGDGWHKNHHDNPKNYTTSIRRYEFDLTGIVIKYLLAKKGSICHG